jgi:hypothetical protein
MHVSPKHGSQTLATAIELHTTRQQVLRRRSSDRLVGAKTDANHIQILSLSEGSKTLVGRGHTQDLWQNTHTAAIPSRTDGQRCGLLDSDQLETTGRQDLEDSE